MSTKTKRYMYLYTNSFNYPPPNFFVNVMQENPLSTPSRPRSAAGLKNFSFQFPPSPYSSAVWLEGSKKGLFCLIPFPTSLNRNKEYMGRGKKLSGFRSCSMPPSDTLPVLWRLRIAAATDTSIPAQQDHRLRFVRSKKNSPPPKGL